MRTAIALATALCGCDSSFTGDIDLRSRSVALLDDGHELAVSGCLSGIIGGCTPQQAGDGMSITADGLVYDVPFVATAVPEPDTIQLLGGGGNTYRLQIAAPADLSIAIELSGETAEVALPRVFAIVPPPDHVSRASIDSITIDHEVLPGATCWTSATVRCGNEVFHTIDLPDDPPGHVEVPLGAGLLNGTCTHDIAVTQGVDASGKSTLAVHADRSETVRVVSEP